MILQIAERPGYFGKRRDEKFQLYNATYGPGNWELGWIVGENMVWHKNTNSILGNNYVTVGFLGACRLYEDSYSEYFKYHSDELEWLIQNASEVFDSDPSDVRSGLDYLKREAKSMRIQDIAIRNVVKKFGKKCKGEDLLQVRTGKGGAGEKWSPMMIPFHRPDFIMRPKLNGWWDKGVRNNVECFYQSNKVLLVKK